MILRGFKLLKKGSKGVVITYDEVREGENNMRVRDDVTRTCHIPVPFSIRHEIEKLKYAFLTVTGYWENEWTKYLSEDMLSIRTDQKIPEDEMIARGEAERFIRDTTIESFTARKNGIFIGGSIEIGDKVITPKYNPIKDGDDNNLYDELQDQLAVIADELFDYMAAEKMNIQEVKSFLTESVTSEDEMERIKSLSDLESHDELILLLESRGCIILDPNDKRIEKRKETEDVVKALIEKDVEDDEPNDAVKEKMEELEASEKIKSEPEVEEAVIPVGAEDVGEDWD